VGCRPQPTSGSLPTVVVVPDVEPLRALAGEAVDRVLQRGVGVSNDSRAGLGMGRTGARDGGTGEAERGARDDSSGDDWQCEVAREATSDGGGHFESICRRWLLAFFTVGFRR
jgi:hypothetical protein